LLLKLRARLQRGTNQTAASDDPVAQAVALLGAGKPIVIHGDSICYVALSADAADAGAVNGLARNDRGIISVAISAERADALGLTVLPRSGGSLKPDYTVSVEAVVGTTTGISAADRATTIAALLGDHPGALHSPGHIMPIRAAQGGVLERSGVAEAAADLAVLAGMAPVVVLCEILRGDDGEALAPEELSAHPVYAGIPAVSPALVRRGLIDVALEQVEHFDEAVRLLEVGTAEVTVRSISGLSGEVTPDAVVRFTDGPPSLLVSLSGLARHSFEIGMSIDVFVTVDERETVYLGCRLTDRLERYEQTAFLADVEVVDVKVARVLPSDHGHGTSVLGQSTQESPISAG
jgi:3,4-dihydroxy-2-butanone 4-phosphate synthase